MPSLSLPPPGTKLEQNELYPRLLGNLLQPLGIAIAVEQSYLAAFLRLWEQLF